MIENGRKPSKTTSMHPNTSLDFLGLMYSMMPLRSVGEPSVSNCRDCWWFQRIWDIIFVHPLLFLDSSLPHLQTQRWPMCKHLLREAFVLQVCLFLIERSRVGREELQSSETS